MKKYFKLGTALALSVLLNLTPTLIPNVQAEELEEEIPIVEQVHKNEIYYENQNIFDDSSIPEEEPLEVKQAANEVSTAEANNIVTSEPVRAPSATLNEVKAEDDSTPTRDAEEPKTVTLHLMNTLNGVETPEELIAINVTSTVWTSKTLASLRLATTMTAGGDNYLFQGWFTAPTGGDKIGGSKSAPVEYTNANIYTMSTGAVYYQAKEEITSSEDIYIYAQWKQGLKTKLHVMNTIADVNNPEQILEIDIIDFAQKSKKLSDLSLATTMTYEGKDYSFQGWFTAPTGGTKLPTSSTTAMETENILLWTNTSGTFYYKGKDEPTYVAEDVYLYAQWKEIHYTTVHGIDMHLGTELESETKSPITQRRTDVVMENIIDAQIEYKVRGGGTKYIQIIDDDYIYTFKGWYYLDAETGEKVYFVHRQYVDFNGVRIYTNSPEGTTPGAVRIENTSSGTPDLLEDEDIKIYADWEKVENPNVKVKINIINTIDDSTALEFTIQNSEDVSKTLSNMVSQINGLQQDKYTDNEHVYIFDGFYTEDGQKITTDGINSYNVNVKYEVIDTVSHNNGEEVHLYSDGLRFIAAEELIKGTINIYIRWTTTDLPKIEIMDVKPNNTELATTLPIGSSGNVIGLDQFFTGENREGKYSGITIPGKKSETDSNHIYNFLGWFTEEVGGEEINENYTPTGTLAQIFNVLTAKSGEDASPYALTFQSSSSYLNRENNVPSSVRLYGRWDMITAPVLQYRQENNVTLEENEGWVNSNGTTATFTANLEALQEDNGNHKFLYWKVYYDDPENENYGTEYDGVEYDITTAEKSTFNYVFQNDLEHSGTTEKLVNRAWWQPALTVILYDTKPMRRAATQIGYMKDYKDITIIGEDGVLAEAPTKEGYTFVGWFVVETDEPYPSNVVTKPDASYETPNEETGVNAPKTVRLYAKWTKEIHVTKVWEDSDNANNLRPETVTLEIHASNQNTAIESFTLSGEGNTWTSEDITVEGFDETGNEIIYTAVEVNEGMPYYNTSIDGLVVTNTLKPEGYVYVEYYDLETNEQFENSRETLQGIIDTTYETTAKTFENYTLEADLTEGETTGKFEEEAKTVKYYYSLNSSKVITHYVDQKTNEEFEYSQEETEGKIGTPYETFEKHYLHYELVETPENATGNYAPETIHVYYYYKWKQGVVNIHHYAYEAGEDGEVLTEFEELQDSITGDVDSPYETFAAVIPYYHYIGDSGNINGTYTEEPITVEYFYEKDEGIVIVHHIDKNTNEEFVEYQETLTGKVEDAYETTSATIPNYTLDEELLPENATGNYTEEVTHVNYYYSINNGQVTVKYINLETNEEFEDTAETLEGKINSNYETVEKAFDNYTMVRVDGETTGTFKAEPIEVTYYYSLNNGEVIVHYVDQDTNEEFTNTQEVLTGKIGTSYETVEKQFTHYELVETPENATGEYTPETINVTYYYKWMQGTVIVHYIDQENDTEFTDLQETITGDVDSAYQTEAKEIEHYTLDSNSGNIVGTYTEEAINVYYYYVKNTGTIIVHHVDKDTEEEFVEYQETLTGKVEESYETAPVEIPNYTLDQETLPTNNEGFYTEETIDVYYYYIINNGTVNVKYINLETNEEFEDSAEELVGKINSKYETEEKTFENYTMVRVDGNTTGTFQPEPIEVVYYYEINEGKVIVRYVDKDTEEEFTELQETLTGKINTDYETVQKEIEHYTFENSTDNTTGQYMAEDQEVIYYYIKNSGKVTVYYVDKNNNNEILDTAEFSGKVGTPYTIEEKSFDLYEWVDPKPEMTGEIPEGEEEIYLYYVKQEGTVEVSYIDIKTGEEIADKEEYTGTIDQEYETIQKEIEGYRFVRSTGTLSGNFPANSTEIVVYYYEAVGKVTVKYLEKDTDQVLADEIIKEGPLGEEYFTEEKEIENYELVERPNNATGTYTEEAIEVIYYYSKMSEVKVYYIDKDNNSLIAEEYETIKGVVGDNYTTEAKEIEGYELYTVTSDEDNNATSGIITENSKKVTYIYEQKPEEEKTGIVIIKYVDEETEKEISPRDYLEGVIGTNYKTTFKDVEGYEYSGVEGEELGIYSEEDQEVTYYYTKKASDDDNNCCNSCCNTCSDNCTSCSEACAPYLVITKYEDEDGNTIAEDNIQTVAENQQYATKKLIIEGYEFVKVADDSDPTEGTYTVPEEGTPEPITVTYIYKAISEEEVEEPEDVTILVQYLDSETNNPLFDSVTLNGKVGETYTTTRKAKEGYTLVEPEFEEIGEFSENTTLTYYYEKVEEEVEEETKTSYVIVKYINQDNVEIAEKEILSGKIGEFYFTTQKVIDGYIFVEVDNEEEGTFSEEIIRVTYTYEKVSEETILTPEKGILVVHYVDTNNNAIADDVITSEDEGTKYVTSQKMIDGYTFVEKTDNYMGEYTNDIIEVTYTYQEIVVEEEEPVEEPKDVTILVQYLDKTTNNPLFDSVTLNGKVGDTYTTSRKAKEGYNLVEPEFEELGEFSETMILTYYYEKVEEEEETEEELKTITTLVQYLDSETNNPLFDSIILTGKVGETYTTTRKAKEGYNLVAPEFEEIGEFTDNQVFNYYYEKVVEEDTTPEEAYVLVHYVDSNGNQIKDDEVYTGNVGDTYVIPIKMIDGYQFVNVEKIEAAPLMKAMLRGPVRAASSPNVGTFTSGVTELNIIYEEIVEEPETPEEPEEPSKAMLIVRYVDTDGTAVAEDLVINGLEGDFYNASQKVLSGYKFVSVDSDTYGTLPAGQTVVTYTYEKVEEEKEEEEEGNDSSENNQPIINIDININNENNSDNHSENNVENNSDNHSENNTENTVNNDTNIDDHSDNHTENTISNDTNVDSHSEVNNDNHTDVNNETNVDNHNDNSNELNNENNVDNHNDNTTEVNNDNHTDVNNENNNEDTNEVNIENNPVVSNDTVIENNPVNSNEGSLEDNSTTENNINIENNPVNENNSSSNNEISNDSSSDSSSDNENANNNQSNSESNNENSNNNTNNNTAMSDGSEDKPVPEEPSAEEEGKGMVVVNYLDENDKVLASSTISMGKVDEVYATVAKAIPNYQFLRVEGNENGKYTEDVITVNYYYQPEKEDEPPVAKHGTVVAYYVDNNGKELDKVVIEDEVGTTYLTDQKKFEGYDFVNMYGSRNGEIKEGVTEVIYLYNQPTTCEDCNEDPEEPEDPTEPEKPRGTVVVYYVDNNGKELDKVVIENNVGETYLTDQKEFEGYDYVNVYGPKNGEIKEGITEVIYLYNQPTTCDECEEKPPVDEPTTGKVIAHYLDLDTGARLGYDITQEGNIDEEYTTKLRKFKGYNFVQVVGAYAGRYTAETIEVTYYYQKMKEGGTEPLDNNGSTPPTDDIEIKVPNTGIVENNLYNIIALIILFIGTIGTAIIRTEE